MKLLESIRYALIALRTNKLRSVLTMLGIIIGVGAVIMLLSLSIGAKNQIDHGIEDIGSNIAMVVPGRVDLGGSLTAKPSERRGGTYFQSNRLRPELADEMQKELPPGFYVTPIVTDNRPVKYGEKSYFTQFVGASENYPQVRGQRVSKGEFFGRKDRFRNVCVIGSTVAEELFGETDPIGKEVTLGARKFRIIGLMEKRGTSFLIDNDDIVLVHYGIISRFYGKSTADNILIKAPTPEDVGLATKLAEEVLLKEIDASEFTIIPQTEMLSFAGNISRIMTYLIVAIAGISLLVGGIGIMNIMLVSVTERTNEIGLRKAVGAKSRSVLAQFLIESLIMTLAGGLVGVGFAVVGSKVVGGLLGIPDETTPWSIALAFFFSTTIGLFFGIYPARKAAKMEPIEALRRE